jgi:hypothetical protein
MDRPGGTVLVIRELVGAGPAIQRRSVIPHKEWAMDAWFARVLGNPDGPPIGTPRLAPGMLVQLRHKPGQVRRILRAEWHFKTQTWTYVVETARKHRKGFEPKFTEAQLQLDAEDGGAG